MSKRYIIKFKNIQDFKQYVEDTKDMYPCIIQVPTPAGIAVGYSYDDSTFDIYIHKYLISTDSFHTMDLSSATTVDAVAIQDIIEQWQEGDRMTFSHDVVLYLKGELILGEYAHWENDTLVYGDGRGTPYYYDYYYGYYDYYDYEYEYPYEEQYDYLQVWYTDGTIRKYEVTNVIYSTVENKSMVSKVVVGNKVTSIGHYAFSGCSSLTSVTIPNSVTSIGNNAFSLCYGLTSITIPNNVRSIDGRAFYGCSGLTSITIPNSVIYIGEGAFQKCYSLQRITSDGLQEKLDVTSSEQQFDKDSIQSVIDTIQEGGAIEFSHESALYLKGELVLGDKAHWDGDTLMYGPNGSGYYYDYSYDYQEDGDNIDDTDDGQPVDLGLPSGTLWMKSNVGATKPSESGKFFQWGDTQGYEGASEHQFSWNDYKFGNYNNLTKYNDTDHLTTLEASDDAAAATTSGQASMPTKAQLEELRDNTEHRWLRLANGVNGMKFWKKDTEEPTDGNSYIFIPAAGYCYDGSHYDVGSWSSVWSASRSESYASNAWRMYFYAGYVGMGDFSRFGGFSVRAVAAKNI